MPRVGLASWLDGSVSPHRTCGWLWPSYLRRRSELTEFELPSVGEVYWAETWIFGGSDPKPRRPCTVVRAPVSLTDVVFVITRTTDKELRGVEHPADAGLGLNKPAVFPLTNLRHAEARLFTPPQVERVGILPEPYLSRLLKLYEDG